MASAVVSGMQPMTSAENPGLAPSAKGRINGAELNRQGQTHHRAMQQRADVWPLRTSQRHDRAEQQRRAAEPQRECRERRGVRDRDLSRDIARAPQEHEQGRR